MKHNLILFSSLIFSILLVGQTKKEQKLLDLYSTHSYKKLEKKAKRVLRKNKLNSYANYSLSAMYLAKSETQKSSTSEKNFIAKSLRYYRLVPSKDFIEYHTQVYAIIRKNALDSNQKVRINNYYRKWLLMYFGESVAPFHLDSVHSVMVVIDSLNILDSLRYTLLKTAQNLEGVPYTYAGTTPKKGFDCSGFTQYVYKSVGIEIPHNAHMQSQLSLKRKPLAELKPGDLVFFGGWNGGEPRAHHTGIIYAKRGVNITVIHCVNGGVKIEGENSSWDRYWVDHVLFGISADTLVDR
ncbi:MAG: cell wall-associated NlpC family hydrolase [Salibacteraceae bacterium]|jgi:cell wall-associated NlpC family hydrolase